MKIAVCIQSYNFNKRLCWMLSSIFQQKPRKPHLGLPEIIPVVSYVKYTGVDAVIKTFNDAGYYVNGRCYENFDRFKYRGLVRNDDVEMIDTDWFLFADSDMVYPPNFFGILGFFLRTKYKKNEHCLYSQRQSTFFEATEKLLESEGAYPKIIDNAWEKASKLKAKLKSNIGAGYCQIANKGAIIRKNNGKYTRTHCDWDWDKEEMNTKSDIRFRKKMGGEAIPLPIQIHLQHLRCNPHHRSC